MGQFVNVLKLYTAQSIPLGLREDCKDPFARSLIDFWIEKAFVGTVYIWYLYSMPVAFLLVQKNDDKNWTIRGTWVAEFARKQGVGSKMLQELAKDVESRGIECVWVNITPGAEDFYLNNGYVIVGFRKDTPQVMPVGVFSKLNFKEFNKAVEDHCRTLSIQKF